MVYTTVCADEDSSGDGSFAPLQVHYTERFSAAGRTSGGYLKREGKPKDHEVRLGGVGRLRWGLGGRAAGSTGAALGLGWLGGLAAATRSVCCAALSPRFTPCCCPALPSAARRCWWRA